MSDKKSDAAAEAAAKDTAETAEAEAAETVQAEPNGRVLILPKAFLTYKGVLRRREDGPLEVDADFADAARELGLLAEDEEVISPAAD